MSYEIHISVKIEGIDQYASVARPEHSSPTYNLGKMFRKAMSWDFKQGTEYKCVDIIENVNDGITSLKVYPSHYRKYEPENKWGTVESAIRDLESLRDCIYETAEDIPIEHLYMRW